MMNLVLQREVLTSESTIGGLSIDGEHVAYTLEDTVRPENTKLAGRTAIPVGRYRVIITDSQRFKKRLPLLVGVPNYEGVRIHAGNTAQDTEGCLLVGLQKGVNSIGRSRAAMDILMPKLEAALKDGEVWITIQNP